MTSAGAIMHARHLRRLLPAACLALMLLPTPAAAKRLDLRQLDGLRTLFLHLQRQLVQTLGTRTVPARLFEPNRRHRASTGAVSRREQARLRSRYVQCLAYWQQYRAVAGDLLATPGQPAPVSYRQLYDAYVRGRPVAVAARPGSIGRDRIVSRMAMLGYTPREIIDVITGQITLAALVTADRMRALGYGRARVSRYLERRYRRQPSGPAPVRTAITRPRPESRPRTRFEHYATRYARQYGIDPILVRAVITHESGWRPQARSAAGAIGLMQLMPATARMLGVNPRDPAQNIRGGVRYLAALLDMFGGDIDAALIGYNAGPAFARKWRKGGTVLYGETLAYLKRVKRSYIHGGL